MRVESFGLSEAGARSYNEDTQRDATLSAGRCLIVADGTGGHHGGGLAARIAVDAAVEHLASATAWEPQTLVGAVDAAGREVRARQSAAARLQHMCSTVALLCIDPDVALARWCHLGDSRILHFRSGTARQLTRDHSLRQSLIDAGLLTEGAGADKVDRTALYAAVGAEGDTRPIASDSLSLVAGDAFLLCTDGVWGAVEVAAMVDLLDATDTVAEWVQAIGREVAAAADPRQDNFTALGAWIRADVAPRLVRQHDRDTGE